MTNPFTDIRKQTDNPFTQVRNTTFTPVDPQEESGIYAGIKSTFNFAKNLHAIYSATQYSGMPNPELMLKVGEGMSKAPSRFKEASINIGKQLFETAQTVSDIATRGAAGVILHPQAMNFVEQFTRPGEVAGDVIKSLPSLPAMLADVIINKPIESALGVKLTEDEVRVLTPEEGTEAAQTTLANAAMLAAYAPIRAAASVAVERYAAKPIVDTAATAGKNYGKVKGTEAALSPLMRNIAKEVVADASAGIIQGGVMGANQEDVYTQAISGLMFAPLGIVTGFLGVKPGLAEKLQLEAATMEQLQLFKVTDELTLKQIMARPDALVGAPTLARAIVDGDIVVDRKGAGVIKSISDNDLGPTIQGLNPDSFALYRNPRTKENSLLYLGDDIEADVRKAMIRKFQNNGYVPNQTAYHNGEKFFIDEITETGAHIRSMDDGSKKTVPADELRNHSNAVTVLDSNDYYQAQYKKFIAEMDATKPDEWPIWEFEESVVDFAIANGVPEKAPVFAREFGRRYNDMIDNLTEEFQLERKDLDRLTKDVVMLSDASHRTLGDQLRNKAVSNNVWIEEGNGSYHLRDIDSGNIIKSVRTYNEALTVLDRMGQNVKRLDNPGFKFGQVENITNDPAVFDRLQQPWEDADKINAHFTGGKFDVLTNRLNTYVGHLTSLLDASSPRFTSMEGFLSAIDDLHETNLRGKYYFETQQAARNARFQADAIRHSPRYQAIQNLAKEVIKNGEDRLEHITNWIETHNLNEIRAQDGLIPKYKLTPNAEAIGDQAFKQGLDLRNIYRWRRQMLHTEDQYKSLYRQKANQHADRWMDQVRDNPEYAGAAGQEKLALEKFKLVEERTNLYVKDQDYINRINALTEQFNKASGGRVGDYKTFNEQYLATLADGVNGAHDMYAASRYWDALREPDNALSRKDYAEKHKLTPVELKLGKLLDDIYAELGDRFGVNADSRLVGYINHYRNWGDPLDPTFSEQLAAGISDAGTRRFISTMLRTGETANYVKNPIHALDAYIRTGVKQDLVNMLDHLAEMSAKEVEKVTASSPDAGRKLAERLHVYEDALLGRPELDEKHARGVFAKYLEKRGYTKEEVAKLSESGNTAMDTAVNLTSASLLGARPLLALRDVLDATVKYDAFYGKKRTYEMLKHFTDNKKNWPELYKNLVESGAIIDAEFRDLYNPATSAKKPTKANLFSQRAAEIAFKSSFQPQGFRRMQAAVYLESRQFSAQVLRDVADGKITKQKGYDKLFLNSWDKATRTEFDNLVTSGKFEQAVHYLSTNEAQRIAGITGMGNAPQGAGTWMGRMFNQLGTWTIANRSVYSRMLTRGTAVETRGVMRRYLIGQAAIAATGAFFGFNMSRWFMTPMSFMFTGGPLIGAAQTAASAGTALFGGDPQQKQYAFNQVKQSLLLPVPFGYAARGAYRGAQLGLNGYGYGIVRPLWATFGGSVNERERSFVDYLNGSYPSPPSDGTNLNTSIFRYLTPE